MLWWYSIHIIELVLWYSLWRTDISIAFSSVAFDEYASEDEEEDDSQRNGETNQDDKPDCEVVPCEMLEDDLHKVEFVVLTP